MPLIVDENIRHVLDKAQKEKHGWVFYRQPGGADIVFTCGPVSNSEAHAERGFRISTFEGELRCILPYHNSIVPREKIRELDLPMTGVPFADAETGENDYKAAVAEAVSAIRRGALQKVVLSRTRRVELPAGFDAFSFFLQLAEAYPDGFVYLLSLPGLGVWAGCSPELFLKAKGMDLETMSLAGTGSAPDDFSDKERREQELVSAYIEEKLGAFSESVRAKKVSVKKAGELFHLCTQIEAVRKPEARLLDIVSALHPTPAVCGVPQAAAAGFIREHEKHQRSLYSGFLGPVSDEQNALLYVNLRCMQIHGNEALLYAGAGIVEGSDPEAEYKETSRKMDTLLHVIFPDGRK